MSVIQGINLSGEEKVSIKSNLSEKERERFSALSKSPVQGIYLYVDPVHPIHD